MTLQELLITRSLTTALIVDDAYDTVPRAEDLAADNDAWSNFIDDIGEDRQAILEVFPAFESMEITELQRSDTFIASIWGARGQLRSELWSQLFRTYEEAIQSDRAFLARLEAALTTLGITPIRSGRTLPNGARDANLVFADLFLGASQEPSDMARSLDRIRSLVEGREDRPPLVVLMSRSSLLHEKKAEFRDDAKLHGSMFRVSTKQDLLENSTLDRILERLALHYEDSLRVATFVQRWKDSLDVAATRFLAGVRRLDLSDYSQIREVLLNFEGQPLGSYLLDIFDRVLQHEIEGDAGTIAAAEALNNIDPSRYLAPYIAGSPDLQALVSRSIWQHPMRLAVKTTAVELPVGFGDVLIARTILDGSAVAAGSNYQNALVVLSPACDLVREGGIKRILLLSGGLAELTPKNWTFDDQLRTPIIILPDGRRMWINWDVADLLMLTANEIRTLIDGEGSHKLILRLRESYALELQQRLLANMGRIGLIAQMPGTFPVRLEAYTSSPNGLRILSLPSADRDGGVCYGGRDTRGKDTARLVLTEPVIDELLTAIATLTEADVHTRARDALKRLKMSMSLASELQRGLRAPLASQTDPLHIKAMVPGPDGQPKESIVGLIIRNPPTLTVTQDMQKLGAVVLVLTDQAVAAAS